MGLREVKAAVQECDEVRARLRWLVARAVEDGEATADIARAARIGHLTVKRWADADAARRKMEGD